MAGRGRRKSKTVTPPDKSISATLPDNSKAVTPSNKAVTPTNKAVTPTNKAVTPTNKTVTPTNKSVIAISPDKSITATSLDKSITATSLDKLITAASPDKSITASRFHKSKNAKTSVQHPKSKSLSNEAAVPAPRSSSRPIKCKSLDYDDLISSSSPRTSSRQVKRKNWDLDETEPKRHQRKCDKSGCASTIPICFSRATDRCAGSSYTSRWYHLSAGEHFCNECFDHFYRSHKDGYEAYAIWKKQWSTNGKTEPNLKAYMADTQLPFWMQCTRPECKKWRQLTKDIELTPEIINSYECGSNVSKQKRESSDACSVPEDLRVSQALEHHWLDSLSQAPLLISSPAAPFLTAYYPDGVGMSPTTTTFLYMQNGDKDDSKEDMADEHKSSKHELVFSPPKVEGINPHFQPFYQPNEQGKALCIRPDIMELDEIQEFPGFVKEQALYLGIRNLTIALWFKNCKEWLTKEKCLQHLICRGLVRVRAVHECGKVLNFLSRKGVVNYGILSNPPGGSLLPAEFNKETVLVIGAGAAGLGAARQLQNFGTKVTIFERRDRIGGRVFDDTSMGICVGKGAQIVTGVINNPITTMCEQANISMRRIHEKCELFEENGHVTDASTDRRVDFHFNAMLDSLAEWRKNKDTSEDINLLDKLYEMHRTFLEETDLKFSEAEDLLLQFHISNLEYACGSNITKVSSLHWDQNENFAQFAGEHTLLTEGYTVLLNKLASGLKIELNKQITKINYSGDQVVVETRSGELWMGSKIIVAVPLAILQDGSIEFTPPLPDRKQEALKRLGSGVIEKIALQFPYRFWDKKVQGADFFGHIPPTENKRGLFSVFYDMSGKKRGCETHVLMTYVSGDAVDNINSMVDKDIIKMCVKALRGMFKDEIVPDPIRYFVTHWGNDQSSKMAYSYVKVGGSGETYETLSESVNNKLYFAGEATNRQFPQTVTGAYLSGVREAAKIAWSSYFDR